MTDGLPDRAWMTPFLNRIADVAGERAALTLATEKACQRIYIPITMDAEHWLAQMIGFDAAVAMAGIWGGKYIEIPPAMVGDKRRRATAIAEMIDKGYSTNQIARTLGVSYTTVLVHRRRRPPSSKQLTLL